MNDPSRPVTVQETPVSAPGADPSKFLALSLQDLLHMPGPRWLLRSIVEQAALVVLYGASEGGKSFLALAWALCIAANKNWLGHEVNAGATLYIVAEGKGGVPKRARAWLQQHTLHDVPRVFFIPQPVRLLNKDDISLLLVRIAGLPEKPVLVVLDTFAMCFEGDENSSRDMTLAVAAAKEIIRATGATVILVHHTGKKGDEARGHSALRAAADAMMLVKKQGDVITVTNTKQKNDKKFEPIMLRLTPVSLGTVDEDGEEVTSCVLEAGGATAPDDLTPTLARTLAPLAATPDGLDSSAWQKAIAKATGIGLHRRTFQNHRTSLIERGLVEKCPEKASHYRVTEAGRVALAARTDDSAAAI